MSSSRDGSERWRVRRARVEDAAALAAVERAAFPQPWSEPQLAAELRSGAGLGLMLFRAPSVAEETVAGDETATGYALFRVVAGEAELLRLAVLPAARRRGLARRLLADGLSALRAAGCGAVFLEVSERNDAAVRLYESEGWRRDGRRPGYYADGSAALLYRREP